MSTDDLKWLREHRSLLTSLGEEPAVLSAVELELAKEASKEKRRPPVVQNNHVVHPMHTWERAVDPATGYPYLYNPATGDSKWVEDAEEIPDKDDKEDDKEDEKDDDDSDSEEEDCCCCPPIQRRRRRSHHSQRRRLDPYGQVEMKSC